MNNIEDFVEDNADFRYKFNRPWCMLEYSTTFKALIDRGITIDRLYPFGLVLHARDQSQSIAELNLAADLRQLAFANSIVLLRGFKPASMEEFRSAAKDIGEIQQWVFGDILVVKEDCSKDLNNVCTKEAMPMHFDGTFKTRPDPLTGLPVSDPPMYV